MTEQAGPPPESAEDLFEHAPCGYLATLPDGTIVRVNRTFEEWTGRSREELLDGVRFADLLSPGGRIYHETHYAPLLRMQGAVRAIAVEIVRADGSRLDALVNSVLSTDDAGTPQLIRTIVIDATDRRRYEQELVRAREREREVARHLQRSMLTGELPATAALHVDVFYRPAGEGLEAGGDWYDAFWLTTGERAALVVGDVVGRGIEAAATMGQLRSAVRAIAAAGLGPAEVLEALDAYAHRHELGQMTTLTYAVVDLPARRLHYACAGHPPPLLLAGERDPEVLWDGRSLPLDARVTTERPRGDASVALPPDAALVLYSDGLVERRGLPIVEGIDGLAAELTRTGGVPVARELPGRLGVAAGGDDVCVLVARVP